ncbi:MAG: hypothetical protein WB817_06860, partial [Terriglobales bacterium]
HFVPDDAVTADFYTQACETLNAAGLAQYEISNFARAADQRTLPGQPQSVAPNWQSRHNLKYWTRQPYLGFGVDAHSMLRATGGDLGAEAVRFAMPDSLDAYMNRAALSVTRISPQAALEESFFLGLRLNRGLDLNMLRTQFASAVAASDPIIEDCLRDGLLEQRNESVSLTDRGRLISNDVFARFLVDEKIRTDC